MTLPRKGCARGTVGLLVALAITGPGLVLCASNEVREAAIAGSWYPGRPSLIAVEIDDMVRTAATAPKLGTRPVALVVPHAGWQYSGIAAAAAYRNLDRGDFDRVVVVAPSHRASFSGFSIADVEAYRTPLGSIPLCGETVASLEDGRLVKSVAGAHDAEHSIEIELPFLQARLGSFRLVPILAGDTTASQQKALAKKLAGLDDGRTLFVFSTDYTHYGPRYGYTPFGASAIDARERIRELDQRAIGFFLEPDASGFRSFLAATSDTICGRHGLGVLLELLPLLTPQPAPTLLSYYASIDLSGMADANSVSYVAIAYVRGERPSGEPLAAPPPPAAVRPGDPPVDEDLGRALVRLARATLETDLRGRDDLDDALAALPRDRPELTRLQAVFVTLNRTDPREIETKGKLRGCIGQVAPTYPLTKAVVVAALQAALQDRRFRPVQPEELDRVSVEVSVLTPARTVETWRDITVGRHGIILEKHGRRAVYLPHVATEQRWTLEQTLSHLSEKAGLPADGFRTGASFEVFEALKFDEAHAPEGAEQGHGS